VAPPRERADRGTAAAAHIALAARIDRADEHAAIDEAAGTLTGLGHAPHAGGDPGLDRLELDRDVAGADAHLPYQAQQARVRLPRLGTSSPSAGASGAPPIAVDSPVSTEASAIDITKSSPVLS